MAFGTSHVALKERARLQPGQTVLVLGAAGGVGIAAVQARAAAEAHAHASQNGGLEGWGSRTDELGGSGGLSRYFFWLGRLPCSADAVRQHAAGAGPRRSESMVLSARGCQLLLQRRGAPGSGGRPHRPPAAARSVKPRAAAPADCQGHGRARGRRLPRRCQGGRAARARRGRGRRHRRRRQGRAAAAAHQGARRPRPCPCGSGTLRPEVAPRGIVCIVRWKECMAACSTLPCMSSKHGV